MRGAARRGTVVGRLGLGFTRRVHRDRDGNIVRRPDGRPRHEPCIDPETHKHRLLMYELFAEKHWSPYKIARHFNHLKVDGWDGWTARGIEKLLVGLDAWGIFIWNRTHREYDPDQDKIVVVDNPRSEWELHVDHNLRIAPAEWFVYARRKLRRVWQKKPPASKPSRNQISATTLFSGTLICDYCGAEIKLIRSAGKYQQMGCLNGAQHAHGCKLSTSKSVKIIEDCLLNFIRSNLLTEAVVERVFKKANAFFEQEARKPRISRRSAPRTWNGISAFRASNRSTHRATSSVCRRSASAGLSGERIRTCLPSPARCRFLVVGATSRATAQAALGRLSV